MPVIAKQNPSLDQLYEYQLQQAAVAADFAVYDSTVTSSIHQRLLLFRAHHHKCASRRRNALANEMRHESRRADWLRRKYVDSVRQQPHQQQASMSSSSSRLTQATATISTASGGEAAANGVSASSRGGGGVDISDMECASHSESIDVKPLTNGTTATLPTKLPGTSMSSASKGTAEEVPTASAGEGPVEMDTTISIFIKREPDIRNCLSSSSPCGDGLDVAGGADYTAIKRDSDGMKQRRLSLTLKTDHSKWNSLSSEQDTRDDLRLTAYDVIAGVISTPPIKPLEPEGENATSKLKPLAGQPTPTTTTQHHATSATTPSTTPTTSSSSTTLPKVSKEQHYLVHELGEFSKIMDEVTQEQTAMELAAAETVYSEHSHKPRLVSPYLSAPHSHPQEVSAQKNSFYQKNFSHTLNPSQVVEQEYHHHHHHHHHQQQQHSSSISVDSKSPLLVPRGGVPGRLSILSDLPSSSSSSQPLPHTPTTPLEHFSSFPSPPPSHLTPPAAAHLGGTSHLSSPAAAHSGGTSHLTPPAAAHSGGTSHLTPPAAAHSGGTSHLPSHPGTPHFPLHPSTPHLPPHPGTPLHPGSPHLSPHPGSPYHPPHHTSAQQVVCQPYPSTPLLPYPYNHPAEANSYQSSGSAGVGDSWSMAAHQQQPGGHVASTQGRPQITTAPSSQGTLKDSILARVSSRVVAIAGQKRPPMLDLSGAPPAKMKSDGNMLDHCGGPARGGAGPSPLYSPRTHHTPSPYETTSTTPFILSFPPPPPHQPL